MTREKLIGALLMAAISSCAWAEGLNYQVAPDGSSFTLGLRTLLVSDIAKSETSKRIRSFNATAADHHHRFTFSKCGTTVALGAGQSRYENFSYGSVCRVSGAKGVTWAAVCDDQNVGYFGFQPVASKQLSKQKLVEFVLENCYGG